MIIKSNRAWANSSHKTTISSIAAKTTISPIEPKIEEKVEDVIFEDIDEEEDLSEDGGVG